MEDCNDRWCEYTGQTPAQARGNGWMAALHPDDRGQVIQKIKEEAATGLFFHAEYRLRRGLDGAYRWHLAQALPLKNREGQVLAWFGCSTDIHDQKQAEAQLHRSRHELERLVVERTAALQESEARFRQLAANIREVFYLGNADATEILYVSPAFEEIWGRTCASLYADPQSWTTAIHPEDRERVQQGLKPGGLGKNYDLEYRIVRPDGTIRWIRDRGFPVLDAKKKPYRIAGICEDITERRKLEQQILEIGEREQRRVGHDLHDGLGQELTGIGFMASSLRTKLAKTSRQHAREAARICQLLKDSLEHVRTMSRGLHPVKADPEALMSALAELAGSVARVNGCSCSFQCPQPVRIHDQQIAINLYRIAQEAVHNAIRHARPKRIWITLTQRDGTLVLEVRDNGTGIRKRPKSRKGIGLEIMRYRAAACGATLSVEPAPRRGTMVRCLL
jgi:PAS domain S-box-containing protein